MGYQSQSSVPYSFSVQVDAITLDLLFYPLEECMQIVVLIGLDRARRF